MKSLSDWCIENNRKDLLDEWDYERNSPLHPMNIGFGSAKKVWWHCSKGHSFEMCINNRTAQNQSCPYCSGQRVLTGENDLQTLFPEVAKKWHPTKNVGLMNGHKLLVDTPDKILAHSNIKVWWQCEKGHEWLQSVNSVVTKKCECPICGNRQILKGFNDLATVYPDIAKEWHPTKNGDLKPTEVTYSNPKKVWWKCSKGHEWETTIWDRSKGHNCPYCSGMKVIVGETDLATLFPDIAKEWHPTKNGNLKPSDVTAFCHKKVWWYCTNGHSYQTYVASRTSLKSGCPFCGNKKVLEGFNDLKTWCIENHREDIIKEWDYERNIIDISHTSPKNESKVWWKCQYGHSWSATIGNRTHNRSGCPICNKEKRTSFPEQALFYYIKQVFPDAINCDKHIGVELDIFIPSRNVAIEYDGLNWHKLKVNKKRDIRKNILCAEKGITLIRVREIGLIVLDNCISIIRTDLSSNSSLKTAIVDVFKHLGIDAVDINIDEDTPKILNMFVIKKDDNSIVAKFPDIAKEWHPTKNGDLKPEFCNYGSQRKVWWQCEKGHEWEAVIGRRCKGTGSTGCPFCSCKKLLVGFNDFRTWCVDNNRQDILEEWNYERNGELRPEQFGKGANVKVWWKCTKGHNWEATIGSRVSMHSGCPFCSNQKVLAGFNDLATVYPDIAKEWHPTKNGDLKPTDILARSKQKVWWQCSKCGFEWQSAVYLRIKYQCSNCSSKNKRKIICVETGDIYNSISEAASILNICSNTISAVCRGKKKTAGGYHWKYVE